MNNSTHSPITALLKNKEHLYGDIQAKRRLPIIALSFIVLSLIGLAIFGAVMGTVVGTASHSLTLSWKTIALVWGPIALCAPSLYVFGSISGSRLTLLQLVLLLVGALATSGLVLVALAPLSWFFTWTSEALPFQQGMNAVFIGLALAFGMFFFAKGARWIQKSEESTEPTKKHVLPRIDIVALWYVLLIIVVVQMGMKLGPWYEERTLPTEFSQGDEYFPHNPSGVVSTDPYVVTKEDGSTSVSWVFSDECATNHLVFVEHDYVLGSNTLWQNRGASCVIGNDGWECSLKLQNNELRDTQWRVQAHGEHCGLDNQRVVSNPVTLEF